MDEQNTIECGNCGAVISIHETRCPRCGVSLYDLGLEEDEPPRRGAQQAWKGRVWIVIVAVILLVVFATALFGGVASWFR